MNDLHAFAVTGMGEITEGAHLASTIAQALAAMGRTLNNGDVVCVTSKIVSKAEGRVVACSGSDDEKVALVEAESVRILRRRGTLRITETAHGFVCANAGIDLSNTAEGTAVLLPVDPDRSARRLRADLRRACDVDVAVVITDTFGRAWRNGVTDIALGVCGLAPILDLRGTTDATGRVLEATEVCVVDEVAALADLVLGKSSGCPVAIVRGLRTEFFGEGSVTETVVRRPHEDLFR